MTAGAATVALSVFSNNPSTTATSTTGTTNPSALTQETWTMTSASAFPTASSTNIPATGYHIADPAAPTEVILVTDNTASSGTSWTVTRGVEGTTPVAHATGATYYQIVSAGDLTGFKQASGAAVTPVSFNNSTTETLVCKYAPVANEIVAGTSFEIMATGILRCNGIASPILTWTVRWGWVSSGTPGTSLLTMATGTGCAALSSTSMSVAAGCPFELQATVVFVSTTSAVANINFWFQNGTAANAPGISSVASNSTATTGLTSPPAGGPLALTAKWGTANTSCGLTIPAPLAFRMA